MASNPVKGEFCVKDGKADILLYNKSTLASVKFSVDWDANNPSIKTKNNVDIGDIISCGNPFLVGVKLTPKTDENGAYIEMWINGSGTCGYSPVVVNQTFRLDPSQVDCKAPA